MMHFALDKARVDVTELSSLDKGVPKVPLLLEHSKQPSVVLTNHTINVCDSLYEYPRTTAPCLAHLNSVIASL